MVSTQFRLGWRARTQASDDPGAGLWCRLPADRSAATAVTCPASFFMPRLWFAHSRRTATCALRAQRITRARLPRRRRSGAFRGGRRAPPRESVMDAVKCGRPYPCRAAAAPAAAANRQMPPAPPPPDLVAARTPPAAGGRVDWPRPRRQGCRLRRPKRQWCGRVSSVEARKKKRKIRAPRARRGRAAVASVAFWMYSVHAVECAAGVVLPTRPPPPTPRRDQPRRMRLGGGDRQPLPSGGGWADQRHPHCRRHRDL